MSEIYLISNGVTPTTAAQLKAATGVVIKTMLQVKMGANLTTRAKIIEWGISFDGFVAALPVAVELFANSNGATMAAHVAAGIVNLDPHADTPTDDNPFDLTASAATGYTATSEGTPANIRMFDVQLIAPTNQYIKQWPLGREPEFDPAEFMRIVEGAVNPSPFTPAILSESSIVIPVS